MAKKPFRGNYITLEDVRVSYDEKSDTVHITSKDKDLPKGRGLNIALNGGRNAELDLREMLENFGMITPSNKSLIPKTLQYDTDVMDSGNPHRIPLGRIQEDRELYWDVDVNPHTMLIGGIGAGKSITQRLLFLHCFKHPEDWSVKAIDLKQVEFSEYSSDSRDITIAKNMQQARELCLSIAQEMNTRYSALNSKSDEPIRATSDHQKSIMLIIEEIGELLAIREYPSEHFMKLQKETLDSLKDIIDRGPSVGVFVSISSQRIDLVEHFDSSLVKDFLKISMGRVRAEDSFKMFENNGAARVNHRIRGRGYYKDPVNNEEGQVQVYYAASLN